MPSYICRRCNFKTSQRANFKRHLTRKNPCEPVNTDIPITSIAESYGIEIHPTENIIVSQKVSQNTYHSQSISKSQSITNCKYCDKPFTTANNCYRHQKHYCKYRHKNKEFTITPEEIEKIKLNAEKKAKETFEKKIKEAEEKADVLADKKAQKLVLCLVDKLIPTQTTQTTTNQTTNTNCHNNTQTNNTLINNNQHFKINNLGKEKTTYITDARLKIMFVDPRNTVIEHIKDTHYHLLHPENFNAKITNYKSKHMKVYEDNEWITVNKKATICSMYNMHERIMNSEFERLKTELPDKVIKDYNEYKSTAHSSYHTYQQRLIDTEAAIITGTQRQKNIDLLRREEVLRLAKEQNKTPSEIFAEHMPDIFAEREKLIESQNI